jgi:large subunit ribosomal protein L15
MSDFNLGDFNLTAPKGANKKKRIVGRGSSSGRGTTAGRGNKGQQSRSGGKVYVGFEGGQMPLFRRVARRGFSNARFRIEYSVLNLRDIETKYSDGETVNRETLKEKGLVKKVSLPVKILGDGVFTRKLTVAVDKVSASAKEKIEKNGGSVVLADAVPASE